MPSRNLVFNQLAAEPTDTQLMRLRCDSQSVSFYADLSAYISKHISGHQIFSLLDIGPRTGTGLAVLRLMHHPRAFTRIKFEPVAGLDIDPQFEMITKIEFPDIQAIAGDLFTVPPQSWDVVTCSHTIEHVHHAEEFVAAMLTVARKFVFVACPFEEHTLIPGHVRSIDRDFFQRLGFDDVHVYESQQWHNGLVCLAMKNVGNA